MQIQCLQHVFFEGPACIRKWARNGGHDFSVFRPPDGDGFPDPRGIDLLVVLGGPFALYDEENHDWLVQEKEFIRRFIEGGGRMLGICLGAQLAAEALGARIRPLPDKEIGWYEVRRTPEARDSSFGSLLPETVTAFHWHGDTFELPAEAIRLASSDACQNQGFVYRDRVLGLQFHLEPSADWVAGLVRRDADQLVDGPFIQPASEITLDDSRYAAVNPVMDKLLDRFEELAR